MSRPRFVHGDATEKVDSPLEVVPWIMERLEPRSVLDVGCGLGLFLAAFAEAGCEILGVEGEWVPDEQLVVPPDRVLRADLEKPVDVPGRFDLALSLEVAEHLSEAAGRRLVALLTSAADHVLFSAAVPNQGGQGHVHEAWPTYWQELFEAHGFVVDDEIRWHFWENDRVKWWYRQNMFLARRGGEPGPRLRAVVHPELLTKKSRIVDDFYHGRVPLRTGALVFFRSLLRSLRGG